MIPTSGSLGGLPILGSSAAAWSIRDGTRPVAATFDMTQKDVATLLARGLVPTDLVLGSGSTSITVKDLYVVQQVAGDVPAIGRVQVVDRRWFWTFRSMKCGYNVRRKVGVQRLTSPAAPPQAQPIAPVIQYWPWSMQGGNVPNSTPQAWTALEVLKDLTNRMAKAERDTTGAAPSFVVLHEVQSRLHSLPIENLILTGDLATCLGRLLDYLPGVGCFVDRDGRTTFYSRSDAADGPMAAALGPEKVGLGHVEPISMANLRPSRIDVLFSREVELRFDFHELAAGETTDRGSDDLFLENVLPIPDFSLTVEGKVLCQGTWITISQALTAWGAAPFVKGARPFTLADLQRASAPLSSAMEAIGQMGVADADADWTARLTRALEHYRRTFRINPRWMGRIFSLKASRVGTLDFTTGSRGKASVYSDYAYLGTRRSMYHEAASGRDLSLVNNQAVFGGGDIDSGTRAAPVDVAIVDEDQGIIHFNFLVDVAHVYGTVFPSQIELSGDHTTPGTRAKFCGPTADLSSNDPTRPRAWDVLVDPRRYPQLVGSHRAAVILTAQPGLGTYPQRDISSPNSGPGPFQVVPFSPSDVEPFAGSGACNGPVLEVIVTGGMETARVPWLDSWASEIRAAFGLGTSGGRDLAPITVNYGSSASGASLVAIGKAVAERVYHALADRSIGSATGTLVPSIEPAGWLSEVRHSIARSGAASTEIVLPDRVEPLTLEAYLPAGVQRIVMRLANTGG